MGGTRINFSEIEEPILESIIDNNCKNISSIERETGIPWSHIKKYLARNDLDLKTYRYREKLKKPIDEGKKQKEIAKILNKNLTQISNILYEYNLRGYYKEKQKLMYEKIKKELEEIIDSLTMKEKFSLITIAKKLGLKNRGLAWGKLKVYDVLDYFHENKKRFKELKKQFNQQFCNIISNLYIMLSVRWLSNVTPAEKDAWFYYSTRHHRKQPLEFYLDVCKGYYDALTMNQTAIKVGKKTASSIKHIWDALGYKSHYKGARPKVK